MNTSFSVLDLGKVPAPIYIYLKAVASLFWAELKVTSASPEHPLRAGTHLAVTPASHRFVSITSSRVKQGHCFSKVPFSSGDLLLMFLWFPYSAQASKVSSTAVCKLREFSNCKP